MSCLQPSAKKIRRDSMDDAMNDCEGLPTSQELMEMCSSPDPFCEDSPKRNVAHAGGGDINTETSPKSMDDSEELQDEETRNQPFIQGSPCREKFDLGGGESSNLNDDGEFIPWRGCPLSELQKGANQHGVPQLPPIRPSSYHTVLFQVPGNKECPLASVDAWDSIHVRLPCSPSNMYPVGDTVKSRWEMVKSALQKPLNDSKDLEQAIMSYNRKYANRWNFAGLHEFFNEIIEEEEKTAFFSELLPQMVAIALKLPTLINRPIPLLRQHQNRSISLTQHQAACLLANAFFCTFPRRNASKQASEYSSFPDINFNRLFQEQRKKVYRRRTHEKLKCLFHYFRRVCHKTPTGTITFTRQYVFPSHVPTWEYSSHYFRKLHVASNGTIEDDGKGMLQVDFAHKMVGGGVLGWGCVQEEIRFVICPELIVARLFTECLGPTEALLITGAEQFSTYEGYADTFMWEGDYQDNTPRDSSGRMLCTVVAMDALSLRNPLQQYNIDNITREANKAYAGFMNMEVSNDCLSAVATGNWGCGVYRGNAQLKALIQLLAAAQTGRSVAYFTFGNIPLRDNLAKLHKFLVDNRATVGLVWRHMCQYYEQCHRNGSFVMDLYDFIHKSMDPTYTVKLGPVKGRKALVYLRKKINVSPKKASCEKKEVQKQECLRKPEVKGKIFPVFNIQKTNLIQNKSSEIPFAHLKKSNSVNTKEVDSVKGKRVLSAPRPDIANNSPGTLTCTSSSKTQPVDSKTNASLKIGQSPPHSSKLEQLSLSNRAKSSPSKRVGSPQPKGGQTPTVLRVNSSPSKRIHALFSTKNDNAGSHVSLSQLPGNPKVLLIKSPASKIVSTCDSRSSTDEMPYVHIHEFGSHKNTTPAVHPRVPLHIISKKKTHARTLEEENLSSWLDEYERKEASTIQTRISDYFYEINIPK